MSGLLHHFALNAKTRTGLSFGAIVWTFVASISIVAAIGFLLFAAFVAITQRYDAVTASLALGGFFFVIAIIAVAACLTTRRHNIERARLELASRSSADFLTRAYWRSDFRSGAPSDGNGSHPSPRPAFWRPGWHESGRAAIRHNPNPTPQN